MRTIIQFALHLSASLLPSSGFTVQPAKRLTLDVAKTRLSIASSATSNVGSSKVDGWSDLNIRPGTPVDVNVMEVVGSDYSYTCPIDAVVRCEKPGVQYDGTLTQRAQVIVSLGPEPPELMGTTGSSSLSKEDKEFELDENEYTVNGGTKIDRTRMYVLAFEKSQREGGTVIRTLKPGLLSPDGSTINLAEVVVSSGPNGDWKEDRNAENSATYNGESNSGSTSSGDWSSGRQSEGMVAFSSGRLGPPGGPGRQDGYTYGPTKKKSVPPFSMPGNQRASSQPAYSQPAYSQTSSQQRPNGDSQPAYSQPAYSRHSNNTYEAPPKSQFGVASSTYNQQQYPHEQPYGRPFGEKGAFTGHQEQHQNPYSNPSQSDMYKQQSSYSQGPASQSSDPVQELRDKFDHLGKMLNGMYDEQSANEGYYDPYGQQPAYGQTPKMNTVASNLDEITALLEQLRSRTTPPGEIKRLQDEIERLDNMVQSNSRGSEQLHQQLSDLTTKSLKWDQSLEKLRIFLSRREGRVSNFRKHLDQVLADYIASENEIMNLVEDAYATPGSATPQDTYGENTYASSLGNDINAAAATDTTGASSYWGATSSSAANQDAGGNSYTSSGNYGDNTASYASEGTSSYWDTAGSSTTQDDNYGSTYASSTTDDTFGAIGSAYTPSSTTSDDVGAIPHWASTWGEKTYQQLEQQQLEMDKEQQWDDQYSSSSTENNYKGIEQQKPEEKQKDPWGQSWQNQRQNQGQEEEKKNGETQEQDSIQKTETKSSFSPFGASHTAGTKSSFSPFGAGNSNWASQSSSTSEEEPKSEVKREEKWVPRWQKTQDSAKDETKKTKSVFSLFRSNIKSNSTITDAKESMETVSTTVATPPVAAAPAFSGFGHATAPLGPDNSPLTAKLTEETQDTKEIQETVAAATVPPAATATGSVPNTKPIEETQDYGEIQETVAAAAPPAATITGSPSNTKSIKDTESIDETRSIEETQQTVAATVPPAAATTISPLETKPTEETQNVEETQQTIAATTPPAATTSSYLDGL